MLYCLTVSLVISEQRVIARRVRGLLMANHLTQRELAKSIGMSEQAMSNKLRGLKNFTLRDVSRMSSYLDVSLDYLTGNSDYTKPLEVQ